MNSNKVTIPFKLYDQATVAAVVKQNPQDFDPNYIDMYDFGRNKAAANEPVTEAQLRGIQATHIKIRKAQKETATESSIRDELRTHIKNLEQTIALLRKYL